MSLEDLRNQLSTVDSRIVELIAERQQVVGEIGRAKQSTGRATRDYEREKDVLEMARAQAAQLGIDPSLAEEIMTVLIRASLAHQERSRVAAIRLLAFPCGVIRGALANLGIPAVVSCDFLADGQNMAACSFNIKVK